MRETEHAFVFDGIPSLIRVPASLHDNLMARHGLLASVCNAPEQVVRDAAYEACCARNARRSTHAWSPRSSRHRIRLRKSLLSMLLTHARTHARMHEKAIHFWQKAAAAAVVRPAYTEAIAHLTQAISLAEEMGEDPAWQERRLLLWMALGQATIPLYGYSHLQTDSIFTHARELATAMGTRPRFSILYVTWTAHYVRGEQDKAYEAAQSMLKGALSDANEGNRLSALRSLGISQMITGALDLATDTFDQAYQLAEILRQRSHEQRIHVANRFAADPEIATQFHVGLTFWSLGRIDEGRALAADALAAARAMAHAHTLAHALTHGAIFAVVSRDVERALSLSAETIDFANQHEMELWKGYGWVLHGYALALKGELDDSVRFMETGFASISLTQTGAMVPLHHAMHCRTLALLGRFDEARQHADAVRDELCSGSERYLWPECQRLFGDYLCLCPGTDRSQIEAAYLGALALARRQGARSWELYAATSLARFWIKHGECGRAVELLAPSCATFTQGLNSPGYLEATSLLEALKGD